MDIETIKKEWNPQTWRCGKLIQRKEAVWHYSVGLNDENAITWMGIPHKTGEIIIHEITPQFTNAMNIVYLHKDQILNNILGSVKAFDGVWNYGWGWNCEHWSRLVTTGEPRSYQIESALFGALNILGLCWRGEAIQRLVGAAEELQSGGIIN